MLACPRPLGLANKEGTHSILALLLITARTVTRGIHTKSSIINRITGIPETCIPQRKIIKCEITAIPTIPVIRRMIVMMRGESIQIGYSHHGMITEVLILTAVIKVLRTEDLNIHIDNIMIHMTAIHCAVIPTICHPLATIKYPQVVAVRPILQCQVTMTTDIPSNSSNNSSHILMARCHGNPSFSNHLKTFLAMILREGSSSSNNRHSRATRLPVSNSSALRIGWVVIRYSPTSHPHRMSPRGACRGHPPLPNHRIANPHPLQLGMECQSSRDSPMNSSVQRYRWWSARVIPETSLKTLSRLVKAPLALCASLKGDMTVAQWLLKRWTYDGNRGESYCSMRL